jgi:hypothetical protein
MICFVLIILIGFISGIPEREFRFLDVRSLTNSLNFFSRLDRTGKIINFEWYQDFSDYPQGLSTLFKLFFITASLWSK